MEMKGTYINNNNKKPLKKKNKVGLLTLPDFKTIIRYSNQNSVILV